MRHLALLTPNPGTSPADFAPLIVEEELALWSMYRSDMVREMHFDPAELTVSLVFEAPAKADVESALQSLPMVRAKLFQVSVIRQGPWVPLEALFRQPVPSGNAPVDVIREIYGAVSRSDWPAVLARMHEDIEVEQSSALPFAGVWRGHERFQKLGEAIFHVWPDFTVEPQAYFGDGDVVLVLTRIRGTRADGGPPLDQSMIEFWRVVLGKAVECKPHYFDPLVAAASGIRRSR